MGATKKPYADAWTRSLPGTIVVRQRWVSSKSRRKPATSCQCVESGIEWGVEPCVSMVYKRHRVEWVNHSQLSVISDKGTQLHTSLLSSSAISGGIRTLHKCNYNNYDHCVLTSCEVSLHLINQRSSLLVPRRNAYAERRSITTAWWRRMRALKTKGLYYR